MSSSKLPRSGKVVYLADEGDQYYTPEWLRSALWRRWGKPDLDPCTSPRNPMGARLWTSRDGLKMLDEVIAGRSLHASEGRPRPLVWCNPPYGLGVKEWTTRLAMLATAIPTAHVVALLPARPGAGWYASATDPGVEMACQALCELHGRVTFEDVLGKPIVSAKTGKPSPARWGVIMAYWGPERGRFGRWAKRFGVVRLVHERSAPKLRVPDPRQLRLGERPEPL